MITIKKLSGITTDELLSLGNPAYEIKSKYEVIREIDESDSKSESEITFKLKYIEPEQKVRSLIKTGDISKVIVRYNELISQGNSFGAYDGEKLKGILISEKRHWNNSLWIQMIQITKAYQGKGIGSLLLSALEKQAVTDKVRLIDIETQNTNVSAIKFYKKNGFEFTGLNMTLYDPEEVSDETAIFLGKIL